MVIVNIHADTRYPVNRKTIRRAVADTFKKHAIENSDAEISVAVVGARKMSELSQKYMDSKLHDVLSFCLDEITQKAPGFVNPPDGILRLGDVVLCYPQVLLSASKDDVMVDDEVYFLTCHGVEHLLGKHHE